MRERRTYTSEPRRSTPKTGWNLVANPLGEGNGERREALRTSPALDVDLSDQATEKAQQQARRSRRKYGHTAKKQARKLEKRVTTAAKRLQIAMPVEKRLPSRSTNGAVPRCGRRQRRGLPGLAFAPRGPGCSGGGGTGNRRLRSRRRTGRRPHTLLHRHHIDVTSSPPRPARVLSPSGT